MSTHASPTHHSVVSFLVLLALTALTVFVLRRPRPPLMQAPALKLSSRTVSIDASVTITQPTATTLKRIDPNTATRESLVALPGVGPALAERIVEARARGQPFRTLNDLRRVKGLGPKKLERLAQWLEFSAGAPNSVVTRGKGGVWDAGR